MTDGRTPEEAAGYAGNEFSKLMKTILITQALDSALGTALKAVIPSNRPETNGPVISFH